MKTAIIPNPTKNGAVEFTKKAVRVIESCGGTVLMNDEFKDAFSGFENIVFYNDTELMVKHCDIVIAVGGDGTIIKAAKYACAESRPILGVNFGRIGFVAQLEPSELDKLYGIIKGEFKTEKRMMLKAEINTKSGEHSVFYALNDVVISRGSFSRIVDFTIGHNEREICSYRADGLIFSTPTGSTAYSLSAGGPVVEPTMDCIVFTPVCTHSIFSRPIVFSADSVLSVSAECDDSCEAIVTVDGQNSKKLCAGDAVKISRADREVQLIITNEKTFYSVLGDKLNRRTE
ncbi:MULTISPECIES: NAD(+)/NADH kinase [unclassified Ruminococcus]|uniref:NAD(+)/NADH kinase n=1 Tax=unclassified Ruminococcus TaxID=2608920 RepID=UPI0021087ACB|nr:MULTISPECIES: NAD(+)/NADH kinase [unclassified Ruminococcus]